MPDKVLPIIEAVLTDEQKIRVKDFFLAMSDDKTTWEQKPVYLEDTGDPDDLKEAKELTTDFLLKKVIKGTADADDIARYNALKND